MQFTEIDSMANDLYEFHLYEKFRAEHPNETPAETAMRVIDAIENGGK